jgi:DNA transposition AAA+ family ATPase
MKNLHESFSSLDSLNYLFTKIDFVFHTQQFLITALETAQKRSQMIGILGSEGMGKSSAIAKYIHEHEKVYYVRIGQSYRISNFMDEMIFQVAGAYPQVHDNLFTKMKLLSSLLTKDTTKKLIIIDDAGKLSPRGLGFFHELRDNTIYCTGFAFVGLPYFQKHLLTAKKHGVTGIAEFYRRIQFWFTVPGLKENEIIAYGRAHNLSDDQILKLKQAKNDTLAMLENNAQKLLLAGELGISVHSNEDEDEGEMEHDLKREKAARARKAKATKRVSSV